MHSRKATGALLRYFSSKKVQHRIGRMRDAEQNRAGMRDARNIEGGIRDENILA